MISTPIYADEVETGFATDNGYSLINERFRATLSYLDPSQTWTLEAYVIPTTSITVAVQGAVQTTTIAQTLRFTLDTSEPVIVDVTAPGGGRIIPAVTSDSSTDGQRFALLAYTTKPQYKTAVLGSAILGNFQLPSFATPTRGTVLGASTLGATTLAPQATLNAWTNILAPATAVTMSRGVIYDGFTSKADVGSLEVTIFNALDPRSSTLIRGTQLDLIDTHTRRPLIRTTIDRTVSTPDKDGTYTVKITALDAIADLAKITKYQDTRSVGISWTQAISALLGTLPYTLNGDPGYAPLIGSLVKEASLVEYLDIYAATAGVSWCARLDGSYYFTDSLSDNPVLYITDNQASATLPSISPIDLEAEFDTSSVISTLDATNNTAAKDTNGEWQGKTTKVSAENAQLAKAYGKKVQTIETAAVSTTALRDHLTGLLGKYSASQTLRSATFQLIDDNGIRPELTEILKLELFDRVTLHYRNETHDAHISRISLSITPEAASASLEFITTKE